MKNKKSHIHDYIKTLQTEDAGYVGQTQSGKIVLFYYYNFSNYWTYQIDDKNFISNLFPSLISAIDTFLLLHYNDRKGK
jgi:hypothetical protein